MHTAVLVNAQAPGGKQREESEQYSLRGLRALVEDGLAGACRELTVSCDGDPAMPGILSPLTEYCLQGGKRLRPLLMLSSWLGWRAPLDQSTIRAAVAIELMHCFAIIHDDIIDNDDLRRGSPALHRRYAGQHGHDSTGLGRSMAMIGADLLFAYALDTFADAGGDGIRAKSALRQLLKAAVKTASGELIELDRAGSDLDTVREEELWRTYDLKTGHYSFETPLVVGAMLAGAPEANTDLLGMAGLQLGRAYQLLDDLDDMAQGAGHNRKPACADLRSGIITIPLLRLYQHCNRPGQREHIQHLLDSAALEEQDYAEIREWLYEYDIPSRVMGDVMRLRASAIETLLLAGCGNNALELLKGIIDGLLSRGPPV